MSDTLNESERLSRIGKLLSIGERLLGDRNATMKWLHRPNLVLGGVAPIELIETNAGLQQVEDLLGRIAYGGVS